MQIFQREFLLEANFTASLILLGLDKPKSCNRLYILINLKRLKHDLKLILFLVIDCEKVSTLNMSQPNNGTISIISLFFFIFIIVMQ